MQEYSRNSKGQIQQTRVKIIQFTSQLLQQGTFFPLIIAYMLIETLQIISMGLVSPMKYQSIGLQQYKYVSNILYPDYYLRTSNLSAFFTPIIFLFSVFHFLIIVVAYRRFRNGEQSRLKILIHYGFILINILLAPLILVTCSVIVCNQETSLYQSSKLEKQCYTGYHGFLCFLSIASSLYFIICSIYMSVFYFDPNPFSNHYFSASSSINLIGKLIIRIGPAIFLVVDQQLQYNVLYIVMVAGLNFANLAAFRLIFPAIRNCKKLDSIQFRCETLSTCVLITLIPLLFFYQQNSQNIMFIASVVIGIYLGHQGLQFFQFRFMKISENYLNQKITSQNKGQYSIFISALLNSHQSKLVEIEQKLYAIDFFKAHQLNCCSVQCFCQCQANIEKLNFSIQQNKTVHYQLIKMLLIELNMMVKSCLSFEILQHYIDFYKLSYKNRTIYELCQKINNKISHFQLVPIANLLNNLVKMNSSSDICGQKQAEGMLTSADKKYDSSNQRSSIYKYKQYSEKFEQFETMTIVGASACIDYWQQIIQQDCQTHKVLRIARNIAANKQQITHFFETQLYSYFQNNLDALRIYLKVMTSIFKVPQRDIMHYIEKFKQITKKQFDNLNVANLSGIQFQQNLQMVTYCAVQSQGVFKFNQISKNIFEILHFQNSVFLGKDINTLLPNIYRKYHAQKITNYFQKQDQDIMYKQNNAHIINGKEQLVSVNYLSKIFPSFSNGLELVCFMNKQQPTSDYYYLIYFYQAVCSRDKIKSTGDILQIDHRLKQIFLGVSEDDSGDESKFQSLNITTFIPDWCVYGEEFTLSNGDGTYVNVELVKSISISQQAQIKTVKVSIRNDMLKFQQKFSLGSAGKTRMNTSIMEQKKYLAQKKRHSPNKQSILTHKTQQNIVLKHQTLLLTLGLLIFLIASVILITVNQIYEEGRFSSQNSTGQLLHLSGLLSTNIISIPILFKNNQTGSIMQVAGKVQSNIEAIEKQISIQALQTMIEFDMKILNDNVNFEKYNIREGVLLYISKVRQLLNFYLKTNNWQNAKDFFLTNTLLVFKGITQLLKINEQQVIKIQKIYQLQLALDLAKDGILLIVFIVLFLWARQVVKMLTYILSIYESQVQTSRLSKYKSVCENFIIQIQRKQNEKNENNKLYVQIYADTLQDQIKVSHATIKFEQTNNQIYDERQLLRSMRNKVRFQKHQNLGSFVKKILSILFMACVVQILIILQQQTKNAFQTNNHQLVHLTNFVFSNSELIYKNQFQYPRTEVMNILVVSQKIFTQGVQIYSFQNKFDVNSVINAFSKYRTTIFQDTIPAHQRSQLMINFLDIQALINEYIKQRVNDGNSIESRKKKQNQLCVLKIISCLGIFIFSYFLVIHQGKKILKGVQTMSNLASFCQ